MEGLQALGLREQLLRGGDDDDHVDLAVGMVVLIHDVVDILGQGQRCAGDVGLGLR